MEYNQTQSMAASRSSVAVFMQQVYLWMTVALLVTAFSAYLTVSNEAIMTAAFSGFMPIVLMVGIIGIVMYLSFAMHKLSPAAATSLYLVYAVLNGVFLAPIALVYSGASIAKTFIITAGMFGGMSIFGMTTKKDLTGIGSFCMMGLWGLILAMIVNIFMQSSKMDFVISIIGVIVFVGLTAFDTQKLRQMGETAPIDDAVAMRRGALLGGITLYLDFINLFLYMLRLFGNRE